ncbi:thermonuclease family protein [Pseudonocardia endophytica]|nr:excalibur calcium-binding domain-containing protein [Pseudonocardia endophytica]
MTGRHRLRRRRAWLIPVAGTAVLLLLGGGAYATGLLSASAPTLPGQTAADVSPPGQMDRTATVVEVGEGDSFVIEGGGVVRVLAADSCEMRTDAGPAARDDAARVLDGATVTLRREPSGREDVDRDGRLLRYVEVPGVGDLGSYMVQRGHTAAYRGFNDASPAYLDSLRALDRDGRRCYTTLPSGPPKVVHADCASATAAGAAPLYAGDPGYSRELDGDGDGVACE